MDKRVVRGIVAVVLVGASFSLGYALAQTPRPEGAVVSPSRAGTTRVLYSLDEKQNDQELIALIDAAEREVHFAIYTFTLENVADALIRAKKRGVEVRGLVDHDQSEQSFQKPIIEKLINAGIPILTERHASARGIMHLKLLVTEEAYAFGSYNWTTSATRFNDEILEIGTDPALLSTYATLLDRLFTNYASPS